MRILYLDTSALVKLYVKEQSSDRVRVGITEAEVVATSRVAYPEARAAFARRHREGGLSSGQLGKIVTALQRDFRAMMVLAFSESTATLAGDFAEQYGLRGFDAIHLASARELWMLTAHVPSFCCYDQRLATAAAQAGMGIVI